MVKKHKKYTEQAKRGIKGEAYFESLLAEYSLPHKIFAPKDLGIDFICEWVHEDKPTGLIFAVQVKTFSEEKYTPKYRGKCRLNKLSKYTIDNPSLRIGPRTRNYWKGLGVPVYLFAIGQPKGPKSKLNVFYKRFTPIVTKKGNQTKEFFFKVNVGDNLIAFADNRQKKWGFARDLYIDYMRWTYFKGYISYLNPRILGLKQFPNKADVFDDLFKEYEELIRKNFRFTKKYLDNIKKET